MTDVQPVQAPVSTTVENLLTDIAAKLGELVQIETYLANKVASTPAPVVNVAAPACAAPAAVPAPSAAVAPAAPAQPSAPPSRPGEGTIGGLVWQYCDQLSAHLGRAPSKDELLQAIKQYSPTFNNAPVNELTAATQYSKWRAANNLPRLPRGFGANKPAQQPAPAPSAPTIGAPVTQPAPVAPAPAPVAPAPAPAPLPIPAASVPSVIAPTAQPAPSLPPWMVRQ